MIYGGTSSEYEVSCNSAKEITEFIDKTKYKLECVKINKNNKWLQNDKEIDNIIKFLKQYDVIFPITHGTDGEDGKLQGLLDLFKLKYVGSKWGPSYICMDKEYSKLIFKELNIPIVPYQIYENKLKIEYPVIVKPANGGSSIGITKANNNQELKKAIKIAKKYDKKIIIEKFIKAKELECAVLEDNELIISDIGEIKNNGDFYDYKAKYKNSNSDLIIPADIPKEISDKIKAMSKLLFKKLNLNGFARIDFFFDGNTIYINEINTIPGFTKKSMYPKLMENMKIPYDKLITKLIENAK